MAESLPDKSSSNYISDKNSNSDGFSLECAICLQNCVHPAELPCGHIFCFLCIKGIASQGRRCAMCRQSIPADFIDKPRLLKPVEKESQVVGFDDGHQWFYEGQNGWWQYDERTSQELESSYQKGERVCELLVAGYLYLIDFDSMLQLRRHDPGRRRRIKRDLATIPKKGIAGLKLMKNDVASREKTTQDNNIRSDTTRRHSRRNEPIYDRVAVTADEIGEEESSDLSSVIDETLNWTIQQIESLQLDITNQSEALSEDISSYERLQNVLDYRPSLDLQRSRLNSSMDRLNMIEQSLPRLNRSEENVSIQNRPPENDQTLLNTLHNRYLLRSVSSTEFPDQVVSRNIRHDVRSRRSLPRSSSLRNRVTSLDNKFTSSNK